MQPVLPATIELYLQDDKRTLFKRYSTNMSANGALLGFYGQTISYQIFEGLKEIDNPHLVKLKERYYSIFKDVDQIRENPETCDIFGYTREYVRKEKIRLLREKKDFLLSNISGLQGLADHLTQQGIIMEFDSGSDAKMGPNGVIITNPDHFTFNEDRDFPYKPEELKVLNRWEVLYLIGELAKTEYSDLLFNYDEEQASFAINHLLDQRLATDKDMASEVKKTLCFYKKPLEFVRHNI